ncbi:MAG: MurR/RpiR family transcriptional regulator, partial [Alphaproteobacteria bacterium]|nr:MurR/RpiR family transcriptional regulator [Alphaproteobacteria bacterium]
SDASVVRFARALGYDGYPDLVGDLKQEILVAAGWGGVADAATADRSVADIVEQSFALDEYLVRRNRELNDRRTYETIVALLSAAMKVWVVGHSTSYPIAAYLALKLNQFLDDAEALTIAVGDLSERLKVVGAGHVVVGIGFPRYVPYTTEILRLARERGATVVAMTDKPSSPAAQIAHHVLYVARDGVGVTWSYIGALAMANALVAATAAADRDRTRAALQRSDEIWASLWNWTPRDLAPAPETASRGSAPARRGRRSR